MEQELKQLEDVKILWHLGYWDGVQSGVAMHEDQLVYFDLLEEYETKLVDPNDEDSDLDWGWYRKFTIYELSDDDKIRLTVKHAIWQAYIGLHTDYFPFGGRKIRDKEYNNPERTIPVLHGGPDGDFHKNWAAYEEYTKQWEEKHGKFDKKVAKPIGWVYYDQLFGKRYKKRYKVNPQFDMIDCWLR